MAEPSLYDRLGQYHGIALFVEKLLPRLQVDTALRHFWAYRTQDSVSMELNLMIEFIGAKREGLWGIQGGIWFRCIRGWGLVRTIGGVSLVMRRKRWKNYRPLIRSAKNWSLL